MSIDTAEKRKSAGGILLPFLVAGVTPKASPDREWRQEAGWSYSGVVVGAGPVRVGRTVRAEYRGAHRAEFRKPVRADYRGAKRDSL